MPTTMGYDRSAGRIGALALAAILTVGLSPAQGAPLPPPRPSAATPAPVEAPASVAPPPVPAVQVPAPVEAAPGECRRRLGSLGVRVDDAAPALAGPCAIEDPVRLSALAVPGEPRRTIDLPDRPVVGCRLAERFAGWSAGIAAPVLGAARGSPVTAIRTGPGFECRSRNREAGAKLSAHGLGLALDVAGFDFADGSRLPVRPPPSPGPMEAALAAIRTAACGWFTTVLGPGSDPFHADHLHLDVQQHGSSDRYRICQ